MSYKLVGGGALGTVAVLFFVVLLVGATTSQTMPETSGWFTTAGVGLFILLAIGAVGGLGGYLKFVRQ